ncbi:MAG: ABC transporter permease subunit, partial [Zetaproteobacteria bacterium]|nr:ABC transporter permease subunit [Zetaproteobacteria bacterium]
AEFMALLSALSMYTAAFISEIVRAGLLAVDKGQREASASLGLSFMQTTYLIVIPQAFRVIVPPLTSQYLNLIKNSSLAAAIGYPDLVSVFAGTVLNQTGQALEVIFMTMTIYLFMSLCVSLFMNWFNHRYALWGRV